MSFYKAWRDLGLRRSSEGFVFAALCKVDKRMKWMKQTVNMIKQNNITKYTSIHP
jgi:hypothetical protein